jgi:luciferase family oxidoreductase group 1
MESLALRRSRKVAMEDDFPDQVTELLGFLEDGFPAAHPFGRVKAMPAPVPEDRYAGPAVWMLGSSMWSAAAAAQVGLPYSFAHFIDPAPTRSAIEYYRAHFIASGGLASPRAIAAVGAICAETDAEAWRHYSSLRLWARRIREGGRGPIPTPEEAIAALGDSRAPARPETGEWPRVFVGEPARVREELINMSSALGVDEVMLVTVVHDHRARLRSYELLAREFELRPR